MNHFVGCGCTCIFQVGLGGSQSVVWPGDAIENLHSFIVGVQAVSALPYRCLRFAQRIRWRARLAVARSAKFGWVDQEAAWWTIPQEWSRRSLFKGPNYIPRRLYPPPGLHWRLTSAQCILPDPHPFYLRIRNAVALYSVLTKLDLIFWGIWT